MSQSPEISTQSTGSGQLKHIIVIIQENHTFDNYFGTFPGADGINNHTKLPTTQNGTTFVQPFHLSSRSLPKDLCHSWECAHAEYDNGKMDGFVYVSGTNFTMGYFDSEDIPGYWNYASKFVLLDNYFSSVMGPSLPNHLYLLSGQAGPYVNNVPEARIGSTTILDALDAREVSWKAYTPDRRGWLDTLSSFNKEMVKKNMRLSTDFFADVENGRLPDVAWVYPNSSGSSEAPIYDIRLGERWVVSLANAVMESDYWVSSAILITWDDYGGWYDHVPPPQVDSFGYGFRVPLLIVSPFAKEGFIDHELGDHTSILRLIETLHNIPPLAQRDQAANNLLEAFDFSQSPRPPLIQVVSGEHYYGAAKSADLGSAAAVILFVGIMALTCVLLLKSAKRGLHGLRRSKLRHID